MANLINRSAVKKMALEVALVRYPSGKFSRVSAEFLLGIEGEVKRIVELRVNAIPSVGHTIK